jgi:beta-lactamase superfamily II metal-dependent hydrolase
MRRGRAWFFWLLALGIATSPAPSAAQGVFSNPEDVVHVEVLDVGQGDSILIRSPEGKTALIDGGPSHSVSELLKQRGVARIDLAVLSHHHSDHYGGMSAVFTTFGPRVFLTSASTHTSEHYLRLLRLVRDQGAQTIFPAQYPRRIELGSVVLTVFPQAPEDRTEENNNSIGIRLQFGGFSMLLPGDAETSERLYWERRDTDLCADATVLKLAHHGSRNGTDARWLDLVRPQLAVASMGKGNEFGHPHPQTLEALARAKIPLLRTDQDGTIVIESDGRRWWVVAPRHVPTAPLIDEGEPDDAPKPKAADAALPRPKSIDLNRATEEELRTIPGIGPVLARRIIAGRPYTWVDNLSRVSGIGKKRLSQIRPFVRVD